MGSSDPQPPERADLKRLVVMLDDSDPRVRLAAVEALGRVGRPAVARYVRNALFDSNVLVRQAASTALRRLTDYTPPDAPTARTRPYGVLEPTEPSSAEVAAYPSVEPIQMQPQRRGLIIALAGAIPVVASLILVGMALARRPLGPVLDYTVGPPSLVVQTPPSPIAAVDLLIPTPEPLCGGPPVMLIMAVGTDSHFEDDYTSAYAFADVIRIVRVDFTVPAVSVLAIPRDLWVPIPEMVEYGVPENRLKTAYTYGNQYEALGSGQALLARTLFYNFGLRVDHYLVVNFDAFEEGIDAIGGITLDIPEDTYGLEPGIQHLTGAQALRYVRNRPDNSSDLYRIDRQNEVLSAARERAYMPEVYPSLPGVIWTMLNSVLTSLSPTEIQGLICLSDVLAEDNVTQLTLDPKLFTSDLDEFGFEVLLPDREGIAEALTIFVETGSAISSE